MASQLQGAGKLFDQAFAGFDPGREPAVSSDMTILLGAVIIVIYTLLGGFWAVSITDTIQGLMMAASAVILPVGVLVECAGRPRRVPRVAPAARVAEPHSGSRVGSPASIATPKDLRTADAPGGRRDPAGDLPARGGRRRRLTSR